MFSRVSDFCYAPRDATVTVTSAGGGVFAIPSARCRRRLPPRYGPAEDVPVELRGAGQASRQVNNFCSPEAFECDKLIAVEVLTPGGNWSSYPPHKHDETREDEAELEEIYYFETPGLAYQRVYGTPGRPIDVLAEVSSGDVVLIPHGWHGPSIAGPGYDLYYLNVMAGPAAMRAWRFCDDPAHAWIRGTWAGQAIDPRLPMTSAQGEIDMRTVRLTVAQALVRFLANQHSERDGVRQRLIAGCFGIFGHGNVAGVGQALLQAHETGEADLKYYLARNEQAMVHASVGFARMRNRLQAFACTASIGPGSTNMVTGAALATINRIPVLLLPSDFFATRAASPVLQELEDPRSYDVSVNDAFRPVSRFWDRINRPEQLPSALLAAMRVLTDPAETGAVTLALPQDVQAEAHDWPEDLFAERTWYVPRPLPEPAALDRAVAVLRSARTPLIIAGGGVIYSQASAALLRFAEATGIPVADTQAGKGALAWDHPGAVGGVGATGSPVANALAREADVVLGIGTRYSDFTTASRTAFGHPDLRFVNLNIAAFDAGKHAGVSLVADARAGLEALTEALSGYHVEAAYTTGFREQGRQVAAGGGPGVPPGPPAASCADRDPRRAERVHGRAGRGRAGRREHARGPADAVARPRPQAVPRRVRLLVHGL